MVILYRRFGSTYRSNLQVSSIQNVCIGSNYLIREIGIGIYVTKYKDVILSDK